MVVLRNKGENITLIASERKYMCGVQFDYELFCCVLDDASKVYGINASSSYEIKREDMVMLGCDKERAERIFRLIVDNSVSPCNMRDVIEDVDFCELIQKNE